MSEHEGMYEDDGNFKEGWGRIRSDSYCLSFSPGTGTKFEMMVTHIPPPGCFGTDKEGGLLISLVNFHKSMVLPYTTGHVHWSYVADKFRLCQDDAKPVATMINKYYARLLDEKNTDSIIEQ